MVKWGPEHLLSLNWLHIDLKQGAEVTLRHTFLCDRWATPDKQEEGRQRTPGVPHHRVFLCAPCCSLLWHGFTKYLPPPGQALKNCKVGWNGVSEITKRGITEKFANWIIRGKPGVSYCCSAEVNAHDFEAFFGGIISIKRSTPCRWLTIKNYEGINYHHLC